MNKYFAWFTENTPSFIFNEKSIEQITSELVSIALDIKTKSDKHPDEFNTIETSLTESINDINAILNEINITFSDKRKTIKTNLSSKETEIKSQIETSLNKLINDVNNFYTIYFEKYPDEFDKGINDVNFDLNILSSSYSRWKKSKVIPYITLKGWNTQTSEYWYDSENKNLMYGDHVSNDGALGDTAIYNNKMIIKSCDVSLSDIRFPENENGYFIGFNYSDAIQGIYFAESESESGKKYDLKYVNTETGDITKYENLVLPSDFSSVWLEGNSHHIIYDFDEYTYLLYKTTSSTYVNVARSNDKIHFAKVGELKLIGEATFKTWFDTFVITNTEKAFIYNSDNSFSEILYNNTSICVIGDFKSKTLFVSKNKLYGAENSNLSDAIIQNSAFNVINLNYANFEDKYGVLGGVARYNPYGNQISVAFIEKESFYTNISTNLQNIYFINDSVLYSYNSHHYSNESFKNIDLLKNKNLVIDENGNIYVDTTLQMVKFKIEWVEIL